jgi:hypothetical protein
MTDQELSDALRRRAADPANPLIMRDVFAAAAGRVEDLIEIGRYVGEHDMRGFTQALVVKAVLERDHYNWTRLTLEHGEPIKLEHGAILSDGQREKKIGTIKFFPDGSVHRSNHL